MSSAFKGVEHTLGTSPRYNEKGVFALYGHYAIAAVLVTNDTIAMFKVPAGFRVLRVVLSSDDVSSAGDVTMSVGDSDTAARFISASIIGQAGGMIDSYDAAYGVRAGFCYQYTSDTEIIVTIAAGATGTTSGTIKLMMVGCCDV